MGVKARAAAQALRAYSTEQKNAALEAIGRQHPKTIVLEVMGATFTWEVSGAERLLENLPDWSPAKFRAVRTLGLNTYVY